MHLEGLNYVDVGETAEVDTASQHSPPSPGPDGGEAEPPRSRGGGTEAPRAAPLPKKPRVSLKDVVVTSREALEVAGAAHSLASSVSSSITSQSSGVFLGASSVRIFYEVRRHWWFGQDLSAAFGSFVCVSPHVQSSFFPALLHVISPRVSSQVL